MNEIVKVNYEVSSNPYKISQVLKNLPSLVACDFETAVKYTPVQIEAYKAQLQIETDIIKAQLLYSKVKATALSHPFHVQVTHFQVAWSETESFVVIVDSPRVLQLVMNWIVTYQGIQIWHNASFDMKHVMYHTNGRFPLHLEDTQLLAKSIKNHVDVWKANTGLKDLVTCYGNWAIAKDLFSLENIRDPQLIEYAAIDPCACFWLWNSIQRYLRECASVDT